MAQCARYKRDGSQCTATVEPPQRYCWWHDPKNAERRSRSASRAARAKPSKEIALLKEELKALKDDVLAGSVDRNDAAVVVQVYRTLKDFIELERRVKETDDLAAELEDLKREYEGA
jgi:hypothetical protein